MPEISPHCFEVTATSHTYGGEVIARLPDGRRVFVPFGLPGERLRVELVEEKRGFARARLLEVLEPSPERITPRCAHFGECGGCHYQHMPYEAQLEAKAAILSEQIARIGGMTAPAIQQIAPSFNEFSYRNHIQFHLSPQGRLGFHRARSEEVLEIVECHLPEPSISAVWPQLQFEPGLDIQRIGLRCGSDDDLQISLESDESPELSVEDLPVSVVHLSPGGPLVLAGSPAVEIEVLERRFQVSAGSFFQTNTVVAASMVVKVLELLNKRSALQTNATILDVYCGVGLFSAFLAGRVGRLIGIESSSQAVEDFAHNLDEFDNVEIYEAPAEIALPALSQRPDLAGGFSAAVLDPPREGLDRYALDALLRLGPQSLVYVSCDPATLARDAKRLAGGGYQLEEISLFDQFPQTYHIESISLWVQR